MKSKKIERLQKRIEELTGELNEPISGMEAAGIKVEIEQLQKEIRATRNRNLMARERHAAYTDLGLKRVRVNGRVFYE